MPSPTHTASDKLAQKSSIRFLLVANSAIVSLLAIWLILGNFTASRQVKLTEQSIEAFATRFPKSKANASALKLEHLRASLGLSPLIISKEITSHFPPTELDRKAYEQVQSQLSAYLNAQITRSDDRVEVPPEPLRRYLTTHSASLNAIRTHLLNQEAPQWEMYDLRAALDSAYGYAFPSYLSVISLQRILLLKALEENRLGQPQAALDTLEASWKLNQTFYQRPELLAQLVSLIGVKYHAGVARKLDHLPASWQQRLAKPDYRQPFLTSLKMENLFSYKMIQTFPSRVFSGDDNYDSSPSPLAKVLQPMQQPYFTLVAADGWQKAESAYVKMTKQDICLLDAAPLNKKLVNSMAWWNVVGRSGSGFPIAAQWFKLSKRSINWELTEKILQVKTLAAQSGSLPQAIPGLEKSSVCPSIHWVYQVSPEGVASISLSNQPKWLIPQDGDLPLNYHFSMKDLSQD